MLPGDDTDWQIEYDVEHAADAGIELAPSKRVSLAQRATEFNFTNAPSVKLRLRTSLIRDCLLQQDQLTGQPSQRVEAAMLPAQVGIGSEFDLAHVFGRSHALQPAGKMADRRRAHQIQLLDVELEFE